MREQIINLCFVAKAGSIHTQRWVRAFAARPDYKVTLIAPHRVPAEKRGLFGAADVIGLPALEPPAKRRYLQVLRNYWWMRRYIARKNFDLVHVHQLPPPPMGIFFWRMPRLIVSTWGSDIIDSDDQSPSQYRNFWRRFILRQAQTITATSHFLAKSTTDFSPENKKVHVVPFGVDFDVFLPVLEPKKPNELVRIVISKSLKPKYGVDYLIQAFNQVQQVSRNTELLIAGDGHQRRNLENLVNGLGLQDKVHFLGHLSVDELVPFLQETHIFAMPSINASESFGVAAIEAQAVGLPVVASNVGGIPEVVIDGETGILVPPKDVDALAKALLRLVEDADLRHKMGQKGLDFVRQRYDWRTCVEQMHQIYMQTLNAVSDHSR